MHTLDTIAHDAAVARAHLAHLDLQAYATEHGFPVKAELFDAYMAAEADVIRSRGAMIGTGDWTADGGQVLNEWASAEPGEPVYYESFANGVRVGHGYVDSVTRKIVQTG